LLPLVAAKAKQLAGCHKTFSRAFCTLSALARTKFNANGRLRGC
jgi:hypothetical protein